MELPDTTEGFAVEDDCTVLLMEKKRRRVSFAHTDTVHVIPRNDDLQTPPLVLNADPPSIEHNTPLPSQPSLAGAAASHSAVLRPPPADSNLLSGAHLHENSADFSHFSCDMDTCHGSWDDEEFTTSPNSLNGMDDDSGCFVHLGHISRSEDDDSFVNDTDYDMTMDATTFSRNLSFYLKSSTTTDLQGTCLTGKVLSNDSNSRSLDDSMALTRLGAPHWALADPHDVSMHADDEQTDMSLATGHKRQAASHQKEKNRYSEAVDDLAFLKPVTPHCALVSPLHVSVCADDDQNDMSSTVGTLLETMVPKHANEVSRDSDGSVAAAIVVDQPSSQSKDVIRNVLDMKPVLMEVKKPNENQQLTESSLHFDAVEPRSLSKVQQPYTATGRPVLADSTNIQHLPEGNLQDDKKIRKPSPQKIRMAVSSKVFAGVGNSGGVGKESHTKCSQSLEDILQRIKSKTLHGKNHGEEENMAPLLSTKLQTLGDYLQFSCSMQPQMNWLREHVQELEAKLQAAKKRSAELRSSKSFVQKLPEDSTHFFQSKFTSKHSLAKKGWLLWKMKPERQILGWLQESKNNLLKEVEAVQDQGQQVLHLRESYSQVVLKVERSLYSGQSTANCAATSKEAQLSTHHQSKDMDKTLEKYNHHYQEACEQLRISKAKWIKNQTQIESIASAYGHKVESAADGSVNLFEEKLKALIERLHFTINLLKQQQVLDSNFNSSGGKSVVDFSLEGMCSQSFQFEEDSPHVKLLTTLHPEAIEMTFPCMDASLLFQYVISDLHTNSLVQKQHVHGIIQRTNYLSGCLMDVLKEIRYCRRSFWISCKFKMLHDKLLLYVTFLRCASGLKVILTFDMVCVKKGMYPSDLKPAHIQIETYGCTSEQTITRREVQARIAKIQPGFARLYRMCSCIEELMRTVEPNV